MLQSTEAAGTELALLEMAGPHVAVSPQEGIKMKTPVSFRLDDVQRITQVLAAGARGAIRMARRHLGPVLRQLQAELARRGIRLAIRVPVGLGEVLLRAGIGALLGGLGGLFYLGGMPGAAVGSLIGAAVGAASAVFTLELSSGLDGDIVLQRV